MKDITKRCVFDPRHEEAQQVGRMTIVESSSGLIDQRQLGKPLNPFVWSELIVEIAPECLGIRLSDWPTKNMTEKLTPSPSSHGKPKGDKRERTRAKLLEAARQLVREMGYEHTTLETVARRAGMTTGAIYGNFKNREELFVALGQAYWPAIKPKVKPGASLPEIMRAMAKATIAVMPDRKATAVGRLTGLAYTLRHEDLLAQVQTVTAQSYAVGAEWLRTIVEKDELPMPAEQMVRVIHALSEGLVLQTLLTPDLFPKSLYYAAFDALASAAKREKSK